jgi:hypothetical protein
LASQTSLNAAPQLNENKILINKKVKHTLSGKSACPVKCLPNEMQRIFHRGEAYFTGGGILGLRSIEATR